MVPSQAVANTSPSAKARLAVLAAATPCSKGISSKICKYQIGSPRWPPNANGQHTAQALPTPQASSTSGTKGDSGDGGDMALRAKGRCKEFKMKIYRVQL